MGVEGCSFGVSVRPSPFSVSHSLLSSHLSSFSSSVREKMVMVDESESQSNVQLLKTACCLRGRAGNRSFGVGMRIVVDNHVSIISFWQNLSLLPNRKERRGMRTQIHTSSVS